MLIMNILRKCEILKCRTHRNRKESSLKTVTHGETVISSTSRKHLSQHYWGQNTLFEYDIYYSIHITLKVKKKKPK